MAGNDLQVFEGSVQKVIFFNEKNNYVVVELKTTLFPTDYTNDKVTVTGYLGEVMPEESLHAEGRWKLHHAYGKQLDAIELYRILPTGKEGIRRYLMSGLIEGVGERTATRIVEHFGSQIRAILDSPNAAQRLQEVPRVSSQIATRIATTWHREGSGAKVMSFLQEHGFGASLAGRICKHYKDEGINPETFLQTNPYRLMEVSGVGFKKADTMAVSLGLPFDSVDRMKGGILHILEAQHGEGHVFTPVEALTKECPILLNYFDQAKFDQSLGELTSEKKCILTDIPAKDGTSLQVVYPSVSYNTECGIATRLHTLFESKFSLLEAAINITELDAELESLHKSDINLNEMQIAAIKKVISNKVSILTGGPGTGKTTMLKTLIDLLKLHKCSFVLAAPTGRAAKRMNQTIGEQASTIHRLLEFSATGFNRDETNPIVADLVVIDEASMLDIYIFHALLRAISPQTHLLLVGDVDQLPSVGAGNVLSDLINSKLYPVTRLEVVFRQAEDSGIIWNAHRINRGEMPDLDNKGKTQDFIFLEKDTPQEAQDTLVDIVHRRIPARMGYDPFNDIQVLAPMHPTIVGVDALNIALRERMNPATARTQELTFGDHLYRVGDKVMQIKNNYTKKVFNGDMGRIVDVDPDKKTVTVSLDDIVVYDPSDLDQLIPAYACTVHRSQGSEYPVVVIPIMRQHYRMLQRNLLYTAVTRAKRLVVVIGTRKAVGDAVRNNKITERWTALDWRLRTYKAPKTVGVK